MNQSLKAYTVLYALFFMLVGGCKRACKKTPNGKELSEKEISIPLPLLQDVPFDISKEQNKSIIELHSPFSVEYLQRFFKHEMNRIGWYCTIDACTTNNERYLLFDSKLCQVIIRLVEGNKEVSRILLIFNGLQSQVRQHEFPVLRYSPE